MSQGSETVLYLAIRYAFTPNQAEAQANPSIPECYGVGIAEIIKEGNYQHLVLKLSKLTVFDKSGAEFVSN